MILQPFIRQLGKAFMLHFNILSGFFSGFYWAFFQKHRIGRRAAFINTSHKSPCISAFYHSSRDFPRCFRVSRCLDIFGIKCNVSFCGKFRYTAHRLRKHGTKNTIRCSICPGQRQFSRNHIEVITKDFRTGQTSCGEQAAVRHRCQRQLSCRIFFSSVSLGNGSVHFIHQITEAAEHRFGIDADRQGTGIHFRILYHSVRSVRQGIIHHKVHGYIGICRRFF